MKITVVLEGGVVIGVLGVDAVPVVVVDYDVDHLEKEMIKEVAQSGGETAEAVGYAMTTERNAVLEDSAFEVFGDREPQGAGVCEGEQATKKDKNVRTAEFLTKLRALLEEYEATIEADYGEGTDTHGIVGENMKVRVGRWDRKDSVSLKVCDGWEIDAQGLPDRAKL